MAITPVKPKKSVIPGKIPLAEDLAVGELAVNTADGKLYTKHSNDEVKAIGGYTGGGGDVYSKYQVLDNTNGDTPVSGCYVIATGQVYGNKEGTDGSYKTLRLKIPEGVKVRVVSAWFSAAEIGTTSKYGVILFDASAGYIGMPNNGTAPTWPEFMMPNIQFFNGSATSKDGIPAIVPRFSSNGINLNLLAIAGSHTTSGAQLIINVVF